MNCCKMCRYARRVKTEKDDTIMYGERLCACRANGRVVLAVDPACERFGISAHEYLVRCGRVLPRLEEMADQARRYRETAYRATGSMEAVRVSGSGSRSRIESGMNKSIDLARDIEHRAQELRGRLDAARRMIEGVRDADGTRVLELYYLQQKKPEDVARMMNCSLRQMYRCRNRALDDVQAQMDEMGVREWN